MPTYRLRIALAFMPFLIALLIMLKRDNMRREVIIVLGAATACFLGSIGLFAEALDWGRWIYMQATCLMLITLQVAQNSKWFTARMDSGKPHSKVLQYVLGVSTLVYCVGWTLPTNPLVPLRHGYWSAGRALILTTRVRLISSERL